MLPRMSDKKKCQISVFVQNLLTEVSGRINQFNIEFSYCLTKNIYKQIINIVVHGLMVLKKYFSTQLF